ncbi:MAG: hypothetical protein JWM09_777, partial [Francisellaceae bacterium]|nr:hypothetical protein [Francisellaceae bacterium]
PLVVERLPVVILLYVPISSITSLNLKLFSVTQKRRFRKKSNVGNLVVPVSTGTVISTTMSNNMTGVWYGLCSGGNCACAGNTCSCVIQAVLSSSLGGGKLTFAMTQPAAGQALQFACGFWSSGANQAGTSLPYAPASCNATNLSTLM